VPDEEIVERRQRVEFQPLRDRALDMHRLDRRLALEPPGLGGAGQEPSASTIMVRSPSRASCRSSGAKGARRVAPGRARCSRASGRKGPWARARSWPGPPPGRSGPCRLCSKPRSRGGAGIGRIGRSSTEVQCADGARAPFADTKEQLGGYFAIEVTPGRWRGIRSGSFLSDRGRRR
jgi:hypothetical protein